jgi:hypothetical protein
VTTDEVGHWRWSTTFKSGGGLKYAALVDSSSTCSLLAIPMKLGGVVRRSSPCTDQCLGRMHGDRLIAQGRARMADIGMASRRRDGVHLLLAQNSPNEWRRRRRPSVFADYYSDDERVLAVARAMGTRRWAHPWPRGAHTVRDVVGSIAAAVPPRSRTTRHLRTRECVFHSIYRTDPTYIATITLLADGNGNQTSQVL